MYEVPPTHTELAVRILDALGLDVRAERVHAIADILRVRRWSPLSAYGPNAFRIGTALQIIHALGREKGQGDLYTVSQILIDQTTGHTDHLPVESFEFWDPRLWDRLYWLYLRVRNALGSFWDGLK